MSHLFAAGLALLLLAGCQQRASEPAPQKTLRAFEDDAQLAAFFKDHGATPATTAPAPAGPIDAQEAAMAAEHGRHLVLLRQGRLFTVDTGKDQLKPVAALDAFAPGGAAMSRYDRVIVAGDTVAVIGYSEPERSTGIVLFDIDAAGRLAFRASHLLRGAAPEAPAVEQIDSKLVLYAALATEAGAEPLARLPALRTGTAGFERIVPASRVYRLDAAIGSGPAPGGPAPGGPAPGGATPGGPTLGGPTPGGPTPGGPTPGGPTPGGPTLHSVTVCDLAGRALRCDASAVLAPPARAFHMAPQAVYVWTFPYAGEAGAGLLRIPFNGGAPGALRVSGAPRDQFSFHESADAHLNVLVGADGAGPSWRGEAGTDSLALLRLPLQAFSDGDQRAPLSSYKDLPDLPMQALRNRFIGPWLVYGGARAGADGRAPLFALRWDGTGGLQRLQLAHPVERIAAMGGDAVVAGQARSALHLSSVRLGQGAGPDQQASVASVHVHPNARETPAPVRPPAYDAQRPGQGMLALAIVEAGRADEGEDAASLLYLRNTALRLRELGALKAQHGAPEDAAAWYGNARPLFVQGRMFALLGDELVEGKLKNGRLREARRLNYAAAVPR
ncbi:hypothetical protein HF313_28555 [Massilia atriviolacea]|uniref:hypothetical protein n=1 Tax=Massilia atriviolacea TaxID=2495579 RepID=UPI0018E085D1|nr:hypothetical protein [Massilia atriviolacea]